MSGSPNAARAAGEITPAGADGRPDVALAGAGRWGSRILRALVDRGARVWVVDPSEPARSRARQDGASGAFPGSDALPRIDAAVIATPTRLHGVTVESFASKGVTTFCEKPLTHDAASSAALARQFDGRLFVLDKWRYHPPSRRSRGSRRGPPDGRSLRTRRQPSISGYDVDPIWIGAARLSIATEILGVPRSRMPARGSLGARRRARAEFGLPGILLRGRSTHPGIREIVLECRDATAMVDGRRTFGFRGRRRVAVDSEPP